MAWRRAGHSRRCWCSRGTLQTRSRGRRRRCTSCRRRCGSCSCIPCQGNGAAGAATRCARRSRRSHCRTRRSGTRRQGRRRRTRRRRSTSSCRCQCRHARELGWPPAMVAVGLGRSRRLRGPTGHSGTWRPGCQYQRGSPPAAWAALSARAGSSPRSRCSTRTSETRSRERRRRRRNRPPSRTRKRPYSVTAGETKWRRGRADGTREPKAPQPRQKGSRSRSRRARPGRRRRAGGRCKRGVSYRGTVVFGG
jgi:hypothetical protein